MSPGQIAAPRATLRWHDRTAFALFLAGLILLPFSTPAGPGSVVVSFGLPLLGLMVVTYGALWWWRPYVRREYAAAMACGFALLAAQTISTLESPVLIPSAARWLANVVGFGVFAYLLSPTSFRLPHATTVPRFRVTLAALIASAAVLSLYFIGTFVLAVKEHGFLTVVAQRYAGGAMALTWGASNAIASPLIYPVFFALYLASSAALNRPRRLLVRSVTLLLCLAITLTLSRGAIFATVFGALALAALLDVRSQIRLLASLVLIAVAVFTFNSWLVSQQLLSEGIGGALVERIQRQDVATLNLRTIVWAEYLQQLGKAPLLGEGYYSSVWLHDMTPHNIVLTTFIERGLIGLVLSAAVVVYAAGVIVRDLRLSGLRRRDPFFAYAAAGGVASLLHLMVEDANFTQQYIIYSWIFLAVIFLAHRELGAAQRAAYQPRGSAPRQPGAALPLDPLGA